ncbi:Rho GDP-dissociation inhibitor 1 [Dendrobium catenatum]|uniref:Rho GDP-dissociation inhibitor 1 n=1 Tax=Dendrobium catenatum TaxID=906689 RepID=A0A2I0XJ86_9ASPA|nr:Rho GDP-dissociation inhibitor 1 [Dendrobium catenatum]
MVNEDDHVGLVLGLGRAVKGRHSHAAEALRAETSRPCDPSLMRPIAVSPAVGVAAAAAVTLCGFESTTVKLGNFSPQNEPYTYEIEEDTTPSGLFSLGDYFVEIKVNNIHV